MALLHHFSKRFSVRKYSSRAVEREKLSRCIEAAWLAPSACNAQPWKFILVDDPALTGEVAKATFSAIVPLNKFAVQVPAFIVIVTEKPNITSQIGSALVKKDFHLIDIGIAAEHICLQAVEEGLGSCMIGWFDEKRVKELLGIPAKKRAVMIIAIGYSAVEQQPQRVRKKLGDTWSLNSYEQLP